MVENRPWLTVMAHAIMLFGVALIAFPIWVTFVASTHDQARMFISPVPLWPGTHMFENYRAILTEGVAASAPPVGRMLLNSLVSALAIAIGKIAISIIAAYAICYFQFPLRMTFFWMIFMTLMLPVEVRILPTYSVIANLGMLNSYAGLTIPLI